MIAISDLIVGHAKITESSLSQILRIFDRDVLPGLASCRSSTLGGLSFWGCRQR